MLDDVQRKMVGHAALILLVGMLAGLGLLVSLVGGIELLPGTITSVPIVGDSAAWVRVHIGGMLNALLVLGVALVLPILRFEARRARNVARMIIGTGWANTVFYWAALLAPNRALTFGANRFGETNLAAIVGLAPALVFVFVSIVAVGMLARQAFRPQH